MAETSKEPVNAGKEPINSPSSLPLKAEDQFRMINQRLDILAGELGRVGKPATFSIADILQIAIVLLTLGGAVLGLFNLSDRISDLKTDLLAAERRTTDNMAAAEVRLSSKIDKLSDQLTKVDERASRLEGSKTGK